MKTILNGGSAEQQDDYVGDVNEVTVDQSNHEIRLHDGSRRGGWLIPTWDRIKNAFQAKSEELEGFNVFKPAAKGLPTRVAPGQYVLRLIQGADGQIVVDDPAGTGGDFVIELADEITKTLTFAEEVTFEKAVTGFKWKGPVEGNVTGNVTGNLTGNSTGTHTGDVDIRGKTLQLDDDGIDMAKINGLSEALQAVLLPAGSIIMWAGLLTSIPAGWALCNGENGTPNLSNRFVMGAINQTSMHTIGGSSTHGHVATVDGAGAHSHSITVNGHQLTENEIPSHRHGNGISDDNVGGLFPLGTMPIQPGGNINNDPGSGTVQGLTTQTGGGAAHSHGASSDEQGNHTHNIQLQQANHTPPYYQLAYIMKI